MDPNEYRSQREWVRVHSCEQPVRARMIKQKLRAWERELESRGESVEEWAKEPVTGVWWVAFFHDDPKRQLASKCRHADRDCQHIRDIQDDDVRHATDAENEKLDPCWTCG